MSNIKNLLYQPEHLTPFLDTMGKAFSQGGMPGVGTEGQGKVLALTCVMENMSPLQLQLQYDLMKGGKISRKSSALLADYLAKGSKCIWKELGDDGKKASARFVTADQDLVIEYTIEDAKAQIAPQQFQDPKGNWKKNPGSMLRARLVTKALRIVDPAVCVGIYTADELGFDDEGLDHPEASPSPKAAEEESTETSSKPTKTKSSAKQSKPSAKKPPEKSTESDSGDDEVDSAAQAVSEAKAEAEEKMAKTEAKGKELMKDNDATAPESDAPEVKPEEDPGLPPEKCTQMQLDELKDLIIGLNFQDKFAEALARVGVVAAKDLTEPQAEKWIARLKEIKANKPE